MSWHCQQPGVGAGLEKGSRWGTTASLRACEGAKPSPGQGTPSCPQTTGIKVRPPGLLSAQGLRQAAGTTVPLGCGVSLIRPSLLGEADEGMAGAGGACTLPPAQGRSPLPRTQRPVPPPPSWDTPSWPERPACENRRSLFLRTLGLVEGGPKQQPSRRRSPRAPPREPSGARPAGRGGRHRGLHGTRYPQGPFSAPSSPQRGSGAATCPA